MQKYEVYWISKNRIGIAWYYHSLKEWYFESYKEIKTVIDNPVKSGDFMVLNPT